MGRPEKPVDESGGAVADFARDLRRLRARAGSPTYRSMARSAWFSPSVLSSAASGHRLPTLRVTLAFVAACDGDRHYWEHRWRRLSERFGSPSGGGDAHVDEAREMNGRGRGAAGGTAQVFPWHLPPAQLPMRPRGVSGREAERTRLRAEQALKTTPLVISGPVGVGKTDFALRHAHDMAAAMPDGQLYADLGAAEPQSGSAEVVLPAFLRALGITDERLPDVRWQQEGLYRSVVASRRLIVLLDNVRDEAQVRPLLAETSRSLLIVVSRRPLLGLSDVRRLDLDVLPRHESITMLRALVGERAEAQMYDRLADSCGDLPLALDVAGRKLAARADQALSDVIDHVARRGDLLDWLRVGDICVRDVLDAAYETLTLPARSLLDLLGRGKAGDVETGALGPAKGVGVPGREELLEELFEELAEAGMLRRRVAPSGYRMDPLLRAFVHEQSRRLERHLALGRLETVTGRRRLVPRPAGSRG